MQQLARNRNEIMQGPAPECMKVLQKFNQDDLTYYSEGYYSSLLIPALATRFNISDNQVIVSYGTEHFLRTIFNSLVNTKKSVLTHEYHYGYYKSYLEHLGVPMHLFKLVCHQDVFSFDIDDCIQQYNTHQPSIMLITSPNNPTGHTISVKDTKRVLKAVSSNTLVVLDEAYWGFDSNYNERAFLELLDSYPNLVILRSFSKYYALAGLRMGYALCGENVKKSLIIKVHTWVSVV